MNNALMLRQNVEDSYCSIQPKTIEEKKALYNALETCDNLVNDCVGAKFGLKDVYVEKRVREYDEELDTPEVDENGVVREVGKVEKTKYRTILFAEDGTTYATGSYGIFNSVSKIIEAFGDPSTWDGPIMVEIAKRPIGDGKTTLTLKLI